MTPQDSGAPLDLSLLTEEERKIWYDFIHSAPYLSPSESTKNAYELVSALCAARQALVAAREQNAALVELLRSVEHAGQIEDDGNVLIAVCPLCECPKLEGHLVGCKLEAAIAQSTKE